MSQPDRPKKPTEKTPIPASQHPCPHKTMEVEEARESWAMFDQVTFDRNTADFDEDDAATPEPAGSDGQQPVAGDADVDADACNPRGIDTAVSVGTVDSIDEGQGQLKLVSSADLKKPSEGAEASMHSTRSSVSCESVSRSKQRTVNCEDVKHDRYFFFGDLNYRYSMLHNCVCF